MIDTYKLIKSITVRHKVGLHVDSEMVSQFSSSSPTLSNARGYSTIVEPHSEDLEKRIYHEVLSGDEGLRYCLL